MPLLPYSHQTVEQVKNCPKNEQSWKQRSSTIVCDRPHEEYHCLQNIEHDLIETCMKVYNIPSYKVGCPWVKIYNGTAYLRNPFKACDPMNSGCPQQSHRKYRSNELYIYPECITSGIANATLGTDSVAEKTTITAFTLDRRDGLSSMPPLLSLPLLFGCMIFIACVFLIGISVRGKNLFKRCSKAKIKNKCPEEVELMTDPKDNASQTPAGIELSCTETETTFALECEGNSMCTKGVTTNDEYSEETCLKSIDDEPETESRIEEDNNIFKATATAEPFQNPSPKGVKALTWTTQTANHINLPKNAKLSIGNCSPLSKSLDDEDTPLLQYNRQKKRERHYSESNTSQYELNLGADSIFKPGGERIKTSRRRCFSE